MLCERSSQNCHVWRRLEVLCDLPDDVSIQTVHRLCPQAYLSSPISICVAVSRNREIMRDELAFPSWSSDKLARCVCEGERENESTCVCIYACILTERKKWSSLLPDLNPRSCNCPASHGNVTCHVSLLSHSPSVYGMTQHCKLLVPTSIVILHFLSIHIKS